LGAEALDFCEQPVPIMEDFRVGLDDALCAVQITLYHLL